MMTGIPRKGRLHLNYLVALRKSFNLTKTSFLFFLSFFLPSILYFFFFFFAKLELENPFSDITKFFPRGNNIVNKNVFSGYKEIIKSIEVNCNFYLTRKVFKCGHCEACSTLHCHCLSSPPPGWNCITHLTPLSPGYLPLCAAKKTPPTV